MLLIGDDKNQIELKWTDHDREITWARTPDVKYPVDEYQVEFASSGTWRYLYLSNCVTEENAQTTCVINTVDLAEAPLFLTNEDMVRARVWALNLETGLKAPSDGWDCNPSDGKGSMIFIE